jgi:hypothetical protein
MMDAEPTMSPLKPAHEGDWKSREPAMTSCDGFRIWPDQVHECQGWQKELSVRASEKADCLD